MASRPSPKCQTPGAGAGYHPALHAAGEIGHNTAHMTPYALYLHIPFCRQRCSYCDFNTYTTLSDLQPAYVAALAAEIRQVGELSAAARRRC